MPIVVSEVLKAAVVVAITTAVMLVLHPDAPAIEPQVLLAIVMP